MGVPGRFGVPELTVLARELCWTIGRLGKKHLAVTALGTRNNNLTPTEAISGWVHGIMSALSSMDHESDLHLQQFTLVIDEGGKIEPLQRAFLDERKRYGHSERVESELRFELEYATPYEKVDFVRFRRHSDREENDRSNQGENRDDRPQPTRITLGLSGSTYRYGAVTTGASVPEREITLPTNLVTEVCSELTTERALSMQLERGQFLGQLILPEDLRPILASSAPVVMMLDSATARIPWEMVALPEPPGDNRIDLLDEKPLAPEWYFLGASRGFTRQLRTTFSPPPEPPPSPFRHLRVLVVADPARDAHLPGAELEGIEIADLFDHFNTIYEHTKNKIEVVRMFGPGEAKLTNVLREIMRRSYDVMHFAGHCVYDKENPSASGWIFSDGGRLTANELRRIDRVPRFIFSNACESGVTPDRSDRRSVELPPTFAESFFARGVANFVCTAWPVDDAKARQFALALYRALLGLRPSPGAIEATRKVGIPQIEVPDDPEPMVMYEAMRDARLAIAGAQTAARTWGAYQHYGDPFFRLLDSKALSRITPQDESSSPPATARRSTQWSSSVDLPSASTAPVSAPVAATPDASTAPEAPQELQGDKVPEDPSNLATSLTSETGTKEIASSEASEAAEEGTALVELLAATPASPPAESPSELPTSKPRRPRGVREDR
jgi:hypothetical protein